MIWLLVILGGSFILILFFFLFLYIEYIDSPNKVYREEFHNIPTQNIIINEGFGPWRRQENINPLPEESDYDYKENAERWYFSKDWVINEFLSKEDFEL